MSEGTVLTLFTSLYLFYLIVYKMHLFHMNDKKITASYMRICLKPRVDLFWNFFHLYIWRFYTIFFNDVDILVWAVSFSLPPLLHLYLCFITTIFTIVVAYILLSCIAYMLKYRCSFFPECSFMNTVVHKNDF